MVSAIPLTIGLDQSNGLIVSVKSDWFSHFLNSPGLVKALDRLLNYWFTTIGLIVDYWFGSPIEGSNLMVL